MMNIDHSNRPNLVQNSSQDLEMNEDLSRNDFDSEKFKKIKNGTFYTEAVPSRLHYPLKKVPEPVDKFIQLAKTFDENDTMNAEIANLNNSMNKEK